MAYLEQRLWTLTDDQLKLEMKVMSTVQHVCGLGRGIQIHTAGLKLAENDGDPALVS